MGKILLAFAVVASASFSQGGATTMTDEIPVITLNPMPAVQGARLTISYSGKPGTVLHLDWDPAGTPTTVTIGANGQAAVTVPTNASSLIVSDPSGGANDVGTVCVP